MYRFVVLYGSETGCSQDVAETIWKRCKGIGLNGPVLAMDDYQVTQLPSESVAIFVCSTTGQGDQPSNMKNFWRFLLRKNLPLDSLKNLRFAVLGLGDSSYSKFNYAGKKLYRRLEMLGGRILIDAGWADDQHDLGADAVVDPWINTLLQTLSSIYSISSLSTPSSSLTYKWDVTVVREKDKSNVKDVGRLDWPLLANSRWMKVGSNERTTPSEHFQEVRVLRLECEDGSEDLEYTSGDVAIVRPSNCLASVQLLMSCLPQFYESDVLIITQRDPDMPVPSFLSRPLTLLDIATHYWDLSAVPRRSVLTVLSQLEVESMPELELEKDKLNELSSSEGQEEYFSYVTRPRRTILELLQDFPHTARSIPAHFLFDILQPIRPRNFSIASPPQRRYLEVLVAVVKYRTKLHKPRLGLCSNWLACLTPGQRIQLATKQGSLNFPSRGRVLMVGPGTGVAPFRSYICSQQFDEFIHGAVDRWPEDPAVREHGDSGGDSLPPATLVFGCRNRAADFHFASDFTHRPGLQLFTAFSRDQPHKIYVQDVISDHKDYFGCLMSGKDTCVMIAGNAKDMPEAVKQALITCMVHCTGSSLTQSQAESRIRDMELNGLYQTETWS